MDEMHARWLAQSLEWALKKLERVECSQCDEEHLDCDCEDGGEYWHARHMLAQYRVGEAYAERMRRSEIGRAHV